MKRTNISSETEWESKVGYSRAVRAGSQVFVSGTTAIGEDGQLVGREDPYRQAVQAIQNIREALEKAGAGLEDVMRTRIYVTDIRQWESIGEAHEEYFGNVRPATSMVEVTRLIDPGMMVEIEAVAIIGHSD